MSAALVTSGFLAGAVLAGTQIAGANDATSSSSSAPAMSRGADVDPATIPHGPEETLLTGDTADEVEAAAVEEVPGGTVIRVETDSSGAAYEAHVSTDDGVVTVLFDEEFNVIGTETGFGAGMPNHGSWNGPDR
jgi:hypothetical protein